MTKSDLNMLKLHNPTIYIVAILAARDAEAKRIEQLKQRLLVGANSGLSEANKSNPYWSKRDAMISINNARKLIASTN